MPESKPKKLNIDAVDVMFIAGLISLGIGLTFAISWPVALAVLGSILISIALWLSTPLHVKGKD